MNNFLEKMSRNKFRSALLIVTLFMFPIDLTVQHYTWCFIDAVFVAYLFNAINSEWE